MEPFTLIEESSPRKLFDVFQTVTSAPQADHDIQYQAALKQRYPHLSLTSIPISNCDLLAFTAAGFASATLDTATEPTAEWRGWVPRYGRADQGGIGKTVFFAKYDFKWKTDHFILYVVGNVQYLLKEPESGNAVSSTPDIVDQLITTVGTWQQSRVIWVYDNFWAQDSNLFESVQNSTWDKVILDEATKESLVSIATTFFDNEDLYKDLGIAWKRGIIFHGPPGNGKTISLKALMHTLQDRTPAVPTLYVKAATYTFNISAVFKFARKCSPCLLVFEDIETIINPSTRSYFLNEVDGLESNDGLLMVATTNFLERLDPGITKRPSRFDRLFLFPAPNMHERTLYAEYWRRKLLAKDSKRIQIDFPERLCPAIASITDGFSFAYIQEAFVASMLALAQALPEKTVFEAPSEFGPSRLPFPRSPASQALYAALNPQDSKQKAEADELDRYKLWVVFKEQVRILRGNMDDQSQPQGQASPSKPSFPSSKLPLRLSRPSTPGEPFMGHGDARPLPVMQTTTQDPVEGGYYDLLPAPTGQPAALPPKLQRINTAVYMWTPR